MPKCITQRNATTFQNLERTSFKYSCTMYAQHVFTEQGLSGRTNALKIMSPQLYSKKVGHILKMWPQFYLDV